MLAILAIFLENIVFDKNTYVNILDSNGIYKKIEEKIYSKIDEVLISKGIKIDVKESIITEEDIKKESDNILNGVVLYLKSGENNIPTIDTEVYKKRVSDILESVIKNPTSLSSKELSLNLDINQKNMAFLKEDIKYDNMMIVKNSSSHRGNGLLIEQLASREEIEAKGRAILKQKGMTEAQARQKLAERGISEEQAWKMLADDGYLDDESSSNSSKDKPASNENKEENNGSENNNNSNNDKNVQADNSIEKNNSNILNNQDKTNKNEDKTNNQNNKDINNIDKSGLNNNLTDENLLKTISDKLLKDAGNIIDNEIQKINLNGLMESSKIQKLAKITSIFHKMFWTFMVTPIVLIGILMKISWKKLNFTLRWIAGSFLTAGLIVSIVSFGANASGVYENININTIYFKEAISCIIKYFLVVLSKAGITTLGIGLILIIPTIKNMLVKKIKGHYN